MLCDRMDIDVWEVIDAAATKPFGFMQFTARPGPRRPLHPDRPVLPHLEGARVRLLDGVHRARRQGQREHAVLLRARSSHRALNTRRPRACTARHVLVLGVAYKADIDDLRESPALKVIELLRGDGADVAYHDPFVPELPESGSTSIDLDEYRRVAATTASSSSRTTRAIDYRTLVERATLVVDLRNATGERRQRGNDQGRQALSDRCASASSASATGVRTSPATSPACPAASSRGAATSTRRTAPATRRSTRSTRFTDDFDDLLADADAGRHRRRDLGAHAPRARPAALEAGKHVFIEKPLALERRATRASLVETAARPTAG